jgi:hypothetical protein
MGSLDLPGGHHVQEEQATAPTDLVAASERLRQLLRHDEKANADLAKLIDSGQPAIDALGKVKTSVRRREVTETMEEFDAARHQVRLALIPNGRNP